MVNFFYQVGYSGVLIAILSLIAVFMAIRGVVLMLLVKRLGNTFIEKIAAKTEAPDKSFRSALINSTLFFELKGVYYAMYYLKLCAAVGPLLGLLGTVLGMVSVFSNIAASSVPDPAQLAGGIWQALLTTVMGLTLAIPALIVHYFLVINLRMLRNRILLARAAEQQ